MDCYWIQKTWRFLNSQFISSLIASSIGAGVAVWCVIRTLRESAHQIQEKFELERKTKQQQILKALMAELQSNMTLLKNNPHNSAIRLSDQIWVQSQGILFSLNSDIFAKCATAYDNIGRVMSAVQLKVNGQGGMGSAYNHDSELRVIEDAKLTIGEMLKNDKTLGI